MIKPFIDPPLKLVYEKLVKFDEFGLLDYHYEKKHSCAAKFATQNNDRDYMA